MEQDKVYVQVDVAFREDGLMMPRAIHWEDGAVYQVDRVLDVRPGAARKVGGQGDRYALVVRGKRTVLYFERSAALSGPNIGRWFVVRAH